MLKLSSPEPTWIDMLPSVRMQVRPITALDVFHAREAARGVYLGSADAEPPDTAVSVAAG